MPNEKHELTEKDLKQVNGGSLTEEELLKIAEEQMKSIRDKDIEDLKKEMEEKILEDSNVRLNNNVKSEPVI